MSLKSFVFLLLIGLCAAQVVSADTHLARMRHERGVKELLQAAKTKLENILAMAKDAASSSVEVVWEYLYDLEAQVLNSATDQLHARGIPVNLTTISHLIRSNVKGCVTDEKILSQAKVIVNDLLECVSQDAESLRKLIENMQKLWETAQTMPGTMAEVAQQCSAHVEGDDEPVADLDDLESDEETHDLAVKANELLAEASKTMNKRELWSFSRMTRCCKSVYSLSKSDLVTIPGQILAASANGYKVYKAAQGGIQSCVSLKATKHMPAIASLSLDLGVCVSKMDVDGLIEKYPTLSGLKQLVDMADRVKNIKDDPMGAMTSLASQAAATGSVPGLSGVVLPPAARQAMEAAGSARALLAKLNLQQ